MIMDDLAPFAGTVGGGFLVGFITGYAIKKVIKLAAVIVGSRSLSVCFISELGNVIPTFIVLSLCVVLTILSCIYYYIAINLSLAQIFPRTFGLS
jgi:hypothetical protein